ncbi:MAG TPA: sialate O-acetylesterase [Saprospiraceae bacterium]|nr:sialate O-acetylesterase [Saprospiraceae bacterium]
MKQFIATFFSIFIIINVNFGQVTLPKYISDGMVLQREQPIKIWGFARPDEKVLVRFLGKEYASVTNKDSLWSVMLPAQIAGGPHNISIKGSNQIMVKNVLFGDVWLCSGQSNMELPMERLKDYYPEVYRSARNPLIRQFAVPKKYDFNKEKEDFSGGSWIEVSPKTIKEFSGVAYFFASKIYESEKIPIGLINSALGGSPAQAWISEEGLKKFPEYLDIAYQYRDDKYVDSIKKYNDNRYLNWYFKLNESDEGLKNQWQQTNMDRTSWKTAKMPAIWSSFDPNIKPGAIWMYKTFEVSKKQVGHAARLFLGCIVDADSVYINGQFVGTTSYQYPPRKYNIPASLLKEGKNEITIRVIDENGRGGFVKDKPYELVFKDKSKINLEGDWRYKVGCEVVKIEPHVFIQWKPLGLYNAMIHPLFHYQIKGMLWYQGESNVGKYNEYYSLMNELINNWRTGWNNQEVPFYFVQLANYMQAKENPAESNWAALRQQQLDMLKIPNTGMAVSIDIGEWNDIHPLNKKDVGERLALHALKNQYAKKDIIVSGPLVKKYKVNNNKVTLEFDYVQNGIQKVDSLKYFELAGDDKIFANAVAIIKGKSIVLQSDKIATPKYVRYAWADNPEGVNFFNEEGLPASPFELKLDF